MPRQEPSSPIPHIRRLSATASDTELVRGVCEGSEHHFNALYERYFQRISSFVYLRVRNRADAEEIVQEVFTVVFRSVSSWRGQSSLSSWIYGIAKNTANNHIRRSKSQALRIERAESELVQSRHSIDHCSPEDRLNLRRCEAVIRDRLASMSEWHAEAFVLRHFENMSIGEIAERVSRSNDAVRSSLCRMKKVLVEAVDAERAIAN
ncbi:MAG: RNA polymerase sigma factor [Deltaproteobacteria bacterium]|nr:RNA polymerase sigma factor [Deltaproteobacteria bacterium]MBW2360362.1 RNA polymerase sigma factor [Deltaproteobacteria bacterium]